MYGQTSCLLRQNVGHFHDDQGFRAHGYRLERQEEACDRSNVPEWSGDTQTLQSKSSAPLKVTC